MNPRLAFLFAFICASVAQGREWHSSEGGRSVTGDFVKVSAGHLWIRTPQGQPVQIKLTLITPEDQAYANAAQSAMEQGEKLGPKSFEVNQSTPVGALCRMAMQMSNGSIMFTGEQFLLLTDASSSLKAGTRFKDKILFAGGQRTFHPTQGAPISLNTYALTLDAAAKEVSELTTGRKALDIYEPVVEVTESQTLGYGVSAANVNEGLVLVDAASVEDAKGIIIDLGKEHVPATVLATNAKLGVAVLACKATFEPARLAPKKAITLGQPIFAVSYAHNAKKTGIGDTTVTKGIVSKFNGKDGHFEHDASIDPASLGGVILSDKGDVVGVMVPRRQTSKSNASETTPQAANLGLCVYTEDLVPWLNSVPKVPLQRATLNFNLQDTTDTLKKSTVLVKVTHENIHHVTPPPVGTANVPPPSGGSPPTPPAATEATGWSISKAGIRHNSTCRYYNARYPCQATDGTACKVCKG